MFLESIDPLVPTWYDVAWIVVVVAYVALFLAALWSVTGSTRLSTSGRVLWVVVLFAFPFLGTIAWFVWGRHARLDRGTV
ncbi:PLDc N-terminal domain-containing protein [Pseudolysinimonas sp.]|jgi:hypothetical protein|uniref:PLDc N-terminal domain-containing protein n=1 Tax=Pseudolysinimonas sp. TaxID=2680009 RepID=UPI0037842F1B